MIESLGYTEEKVRQMSENTEDIEEIELVNTEIRKSFIEGIGVFTTKDIPNESVIGVARKGLKRTQIGRYTNHSNAPNSYAKAEGNDIVFIAAEDIRSGEEVTIDYKQATEVAIMVNKKCLV